MPSPERVAAIDNLSQRAHRLGVGSLAGIGRWLHTLGYRGHITTKSRRYSVTMGELRDRRATWTREQATKHAPPQHHPEFEATGSGETLWEFDRAGHATPGDRTLVISAALRHIDSRRTGLAESRALRHKELRDKGLPGVGDG